MPEERETIESRSSASQEVYQQTKFMAWFEKAFPWLLVSGAALGLVLMIFLPVIFFQEKTAEQLLAQSNLRLALLYTTGGVIAALGLLETYRKNTNDRAKANADIKAALKNQEHQAEVLKEQIRQFDENAFKERKAERRERYTKAIEQLGDEKAPIRTGGVYTLVGLVDEWLEEESISEDERLKEGQVIINNLCAYIRSPFTLASHYDELSQDSPTGSYENRAQEFYTDKAMLESEADVRLSIVEEIHKKVRWSPAKGKITKKDNIIHKPSIDNILEGQWSKFTYNFSGSNFFYPVNLNGSYWMESINLNNSCFHEDLNLRDSYYRGNVNFCNSTYKNSAYFQDNTYYKNAIFKDSKYCTSVTAKPSNKCADFSGSTYYNYTDFKNSKYYNDAFFNDSNYYSKINFSNSKHYNNYQGAKRNYSIANFSFSKYFDVVKFDNLEVEGHVYFDNSIYAGGLITSSNPESDNYKTYYACTFERSKFHQLTKFEKSCYIGETYFKNSTYLGETIFKNSIYCGIADFSSSKYYNTVDFSFSKYLSRVYFQKSEYFKNSYFTHSLYKGKSLASKRIYNGVIKFNSSIYINDVNLSSSIYKNNAPLFFIESSKSRSMSKFASKYNNFTESATTKKTIAIDPHTNLPEKCASLTVHEKRYILDLLDSIDIDKIIYNPESMSSENKSEIINRINNTLDEDFGYCLQSMVYF